MSDRIVIDPNVCHGKPVVQGTRLPVAYVLGNLAAGASYDELKEEYGLSPEDIRAALNFASEVIETEKFLPASL